MMSHFSKAFKILYYNIFHVAEPPEETGGDENRRRQKTNHATVHRSTRHGVRKHDTNVIPLRNVAPLKNNKYILHYI